MALNHFANSFLKSCNCRCLLQVLQTQRSFGSSVVPKTPQWKEIDSKYLRPKTILTQEEVEHLESQSLVQYKNTDVEKARLEDTIRFADSLQVVNTDNIEPMVSLLENESLYLREDVVTDKGCTKDILRNAKVVIEDYFVAPPGNVAFSESKKTSA